MNAEPVRSSGLDMRLIAACKDDAEIAEWWAEAWAMHAENRPLWRSRVRRMKARAERAAERVAVTRGKPHIGEHSNTPKGDA